MKEKYHVTRIVIRDADIVTDDIEALRKEYEKVSNATDINFVFEEIQEDDSKKPIDNGSIDSKTTMGSSHSAQH